MVDMKIQLQSLSEEAQRVKESMIDLRAEREGHVAFLSTEDRHFKADIDADHCYAKVGVIFLKSSTARTRAFSKQAIVKIDNELQVQEREYGKITAENAMLLCERLMTSLRLRAIIEEMIKLQGIGFTDANDNHSDAIFDETFGLAS